MDKFNVLKSVEISDNLAVYMMEIVESLGKGVSLSSISEDLRSDSHYAQLALGQGFHEMREELRLLKSLKQELKALISQVGGPTKVADLLENQVSN